MSVSLMSVAFKAAVTSTQKIVLLALCDSANDQGECYPSVSTLVEKCSLSIRAVQGAIGELEGMGYMRREYRSGRSTVYWMTPASGAPRSTCTPHQVHHTPAPAAPPPPQDVHPTPAAPAPITITEPSVEPSMKQKARARNPEVEQGALVEAGFTPEAAADFIEHKRAVKAPLTPRAWADHLAESAKAGWTPQAAAEKVMARGWKGFDAKYVAGEQRSKSSETPYQRSIRERVSRMTGGILGSTPPGHSADIIDITEASYADARALR